VCKWRAYSGIKSPIPSDCCLLTYSSLVYIFLRVNSAIRSLADKKLIGSGWAALKTIDRKVDVISTREEVFLLNSIFLPIAPAQDFALSFLNTQTAPRLYTHSLIITHIPTQKIHAGISFNNERRGDSPSVSMKRSHKDTKLKTQCAPRNAFPQHRWRRTARAESARDVNSQTQVHLSARREDILLQQKVSISRASGTLDAPVFL